MSFFFINAALLSAAVAAAVPVIIHLLHRRRAKQDALPTLRFLKAGIAANRRRFRMRHWLVLALRMLAVLLIVAALARPAYKGPVAFRRGTAPVNAVIVLDNSLSMAYEEAGLRRFDRARQLAAEILRGLSPGSRVGLVVTGLGPRGESFDREPSFNKTGIEDALDKLDVCAYGGDCTNSLTGAYAMLAQAGPLDSADGAGEVYVLSDLLRHSWKGLGAVKPPENARTIVLDAGGDRSEDFCVASVQGSRLTSATGHIALKVEVSSAALAAKRLVEVHLEGTKRAERLVDMPANARASLDFDLPVTAGSGPLEGWVALADSDPLLSDNTRYFTVEAARALRCLVIERKDSGSAGRSGFFVGNALEPATLAGASFSRVKYVDVRGFKRADLDDADVVILADVAGLPADMLRSIADFTSAGNGLVIFAGNAAQAKDWAALIDDWFGMKLDEVASASEGRPASMANIAFDHPLLASFREGRNGNLAQARFLRWRRFVPSGAAPKAVELARLDSGDPLLMAAAVGSGRAVLAAFTPVREATDLVLRATFVPLVNEVVGYAAGGKSPATGSGSRDFTVGEKVSFSIARSGQETHAEINAPWGGNPLDVLIPPGAIGFSFVPFFPGNYEARIPGGAETAGFSVNIAGTEAQFERVPPDEITSSIGGCVVAKDLSESPVQRVYGYTRGARELFDVFLIAAIAVLAVEEYLANRFYSQTQADSEVT